MVKKVANQKEEARKALYQNIHFYQPSTLESNRQPKENPNILNVGMSPIYIVTPAHHVISMDEFLSEINKDASWPWRLIDTVDGRGWVTLKVNLNHTQGRIKDHFSKILRLLFEEVKKHHCIMKRVSNREFDLYLEVYKLRKKDGWTFAKIAKKMFPGDFKDRTGEGAKIESAIKKVQRFYKKAKKIIEGE